MKVELISWTNDPVNTVASAASVCYNSEPNEKIVKQCLASGHHSVVEHMNFTFRIEGVSRALSHQLVRHRIASYSQRSQRYCDEDGVEAVTPPSIEENEGALDAYRSAMEKISEAYHELQTLGIPNEDARFILPNACGTIIYVTMNLRTLAHFMNERLCTRAQWEIRKMASRMKTAIANNQERMGLSDSEMDLILGVLVPKCEAGKIKFCPEHKSCGRQKTAKEINEILFDEKLAEWIVANDCLYCSECFSAYVPPFNGMKYCSYCGAKMKEDK